MPRKYRRHYTLRAKFKFARRSYYAVANQATYEHIPLGGAATSGRAEDSYREYAGGSRLAYANGNPLIPYLSECFHVVKTSASTSVCGKRYRVGPYQTWQDAEEVCRLLNSNQYGYRFPHPPLSFYSPYMAGVWVHAEAGKAETPYEHIVYGWVYRDRTRKGASKTPIVIPFCRTVDVQFLHTSIDTPRTAALLTAIEHVSPGYKTGRSHAPLVEAVGGEGRGDITAAVGAIRSRHEIEPEGPYSLTLKETGDLNWFRQEVHGSLGRKLPVLCNINTFPLVIDGLEYKGGRYFYRVSLFCVDTRQWVHDWYREEFWFNRGGFLRNEDKNRTIYLEEYMVISWQS